MGKELPTFYRASVTMGGAWWELAAKDGELCFVSPGGKTVDEMKLEVKGQKVRVLPYGKELVDRKVLALPSEPVDYGTTSQLCEGLQSYIHKYVDITTRFERTAAVYALMTAAYTKLPTSPYLRVLGDFGSGKSRFLEVMALLCFHGILGSGQSPSWIFRLIDRLPCTLAIDEATLIRREWKTEFYQILLTGFKSTGVVGRAESRGEGYEPSVFRTYCPKILSSRERFDDTALESRWFSEIMLPTTRTDLPLELPPKAYEEALDLRNRLLDWRFKNLEHVNFDFFWRLEGASPRLAQLIAPLRAVAEDGWKKELVKLRKEWEANLMDTLAMSEVTWVAEALLEFLNEGDSSPLVRQVADRVRANQGIEREEDFGPRHCGFMLGKVPVNKKKTKRGVVVDLTDAEWKALRERWEWVLGEGEDFKSQQTLDESANIRRLMADAIEPGVCARCKKHPVDLKFIDVNGRRFCETCGTGIASST